MNMIRIRFNSRCRYGSTSLNTRDPVCQHYLCLDSIWRLGQSPIETRTVPFSIRQVYVVYPGVYKDPPPTPQRGIKKNVEIWPTNHPLADNIYNLTDIINTDLTDNFHFVCASVNIDRENVNIVCEMVICLPVCQINMAVYFWHLVKSDLSIVCYCTPVHWISHFYKAPETHGHV